MVNRHGADRLAAVRAARSGDIIVMLAMEADKHPPVLARHLVSLQKVVGGSPPDMIHVTLQRFGAARIGSGKKLFNQLQDVHTSLVSFDVFADGYLPVYSDFLDMNLLKWTVPGTDALKSWYRLVDKIGKDLGLQPLYLRRGFGAWVTALLEIDPSNRAKLDKIRIPKPLFRVCRLVVSRLRAQASYEHIGEFIF